MYSALLDRLFDHLKSQLENVEIAEIPSFKVRVYMRDKLVEDGMSTYLANRTVANMDVEFPIDLDDVAMTKVYQIIDFYVSAMLDVHDAVIENFGNDADDVYLTLTKDINLNIE